MKTLFCALLATSMFLNTTAYAGCASEYQEARVTLRKVENTAGTIVLVGSLVLLFGGLVKLPQSGIPGLKSFIGVSSVWVGSATAIGARNKPSRREKLLYNKGIDGGRPDQVFKKDIRRSENPELTRQEIYNIIQQGDQNFDFCPMNTETGKRELLSFGEIKDYIRSGLKAKGLISQ